MKGFIPLIFFCLSFNFVSSDQYYEACNPIKCGGINMTSPFYVAGQQPSYCGVPGFQVSCKHNLPLLNISGDTYIIKHISYTNQTLWIVNSAFSTSTFGCISITNSVHNFTTNNPSLEFTSKPGEIVLLQDCSIKALTAMSNYTNIICNDNSYRNTSVSLVGAYDTDLNWKEVDGECRWSVLVPYEDSGATKMEDKIRAGFALKWTIGARCNSCQTSGGRCIYNQTTMEFTCSCFNGSANYEICMIYGKDSLAGKVLGSFIIMGLALGGVVLIFICCMRIVSSGVKLAKSRRQRARGNRNVEDFIRSQESNSPKRYTYKHIKKMTNSFKDKLGEGGYSVVYKGKLLDGRLVAVKLLKQSEGDGEDFINEVASISRTNHVNVVTLLGFCFEGQKRCLVYEFMPNGSLEKFRRDRTDNVESLSWETLFQIALGIARGLEYLHRGCNTRILHFDIKPHNILLGENFCPKISDFGLAKLCPQTDRSRISMSVARGTIGYIAPEVYCRNFGDVSHKSDVYSYGMMVLEVIGCRENENANVHTSSSEYFPDWIYKQINCEEEVGGSEDRVLKRKMILVSLWCIQAIPSSRPSMGRVVPMLEGSPDSIEVPSIPTFSSPPRAHVDVDPSGSSTMTNDSYSELMMENGHLQGKKEIASTTMRRLRVCLSFPPQTHSLLSENKSTRHTG